MDVIVNKYRVHMSENDGTLRKSKTVIASTEQEAIEKVRHDEWWYDEGRGYDHKSLKWPLTFKAELWNK